MKILKNNILNLERFILLISMVESFCLGKVFSSGTNFSALNTLEKYLESSRYSLIVGIFFIFFMSDRLIYLKDEKNNTQLQLRKYGCLWFFLFYTLHLVFSFSFDGWLFLVNGRWIGLFLLISKVAAIIFFGMELNKKTFIRALPGNMLNVLYAIGMCILLIIDILVLQSTGLINNIIEILEFVLLACILFGPFQNG